MRSVWLSSRAPKPAEASKNLEASESRDLGAAA